MAEQATPTLVQKCSNCKKVKPLKEFSKQASCELGYRKECKLCRNAKAREWYNKNKDYRMKTVSAWREANRDKIAKAGANWTKANAEKKSNHYHARKARLRQNGVFKISQKDLIKIYMSQCFYCGSKGKMTQDHVVPIHRGGRHSIGNLVAACQVCNSSKQDKTITEWKLHLQKKLSKGGK